MRNRYRVVLSIALAFVLGFASAFPITDTADKYISKEQDRGLKYIYHRYDTPCNAWSFFQKKGYH